MTEPCDHNYPRHGDLCVGCHQPMPGTLTEAALMVARLEPLFYDGEWGSTCAYCYTPAMVENGVGVVTHEANCEWANLRDALTALGVEL